MSIADHENGCKGDVGLVFHGWQEQTLCLTCRRQDHRDQYGLLCAIDKENGTIDGLAY